MKTLLLTTALVSLIAAMPVMAQTEGDTTTMTGSTGTFTPPEGYTAFDATTLTVDDLQGATIYDANGESVGSISDFVLTGAESGTSGAAGMDASGGVSDTGSTTTDTTDGTTSGSATTDNTTGTGGTSDSGDTSSGSGAGTTATDSTNSGSNSGATVEGTGGTGDSGDTSTGMASTDGTGTVTGTGTEDQQALDVGQGRISHVVLDVGGFLGMGVHTVAIPIEELQVFRDTNNDIRVYLPWTEDQLKALPEYDENNPSTLDATTNMGSGTSGSGTDSTEPMDGSASDDTGTGTTDTESGSGKETGTTD